MKWWLVIMMLIRWQCCFAQTRYDVVISEIMADPSPVVGLPNVEWVELTNVSTISINLAGWQLRDATSATGLFPSYNLQPDSSIVICATSSVNALAQFGKVLGVSSFPSLDNEKDILQLTTAKGLTIHGVRYNVSWHQNSLKSNGGWTLEMRDVHHGCSFENNWSSSIDKTGGTPGRKNSIAVIISDHDPPHANRSFASDSLTVHIFFDKTLDSADAVLIKHYEIDGGLMPNTVSCIAPLFNEVIVKTKTIINNGQVYSIRINGLIDCSGNEMLSHTLLTGRSVSVDLNTIVINEILFNPRSNAFDYVELFNPGPYIHDLSECYLSNRNTQGNINIPQRVVTTKQHLYPGDYVVCTENLYSLQKEYLVKDPLTVIEMPGLPSFPDDKGSVVLTNAQGRIIEEVNYDEKWQFELLNNKVGVALERIAARQPANNSQNWHSAAATAGYGTPGYMNSQSGVSVEGDEWITLQPSVISPDNDGRDDFLTIYYAMPEPGFVASIEVFDLDGRKVKNIARQELLGLKGRWTWNGTNESGSVQHVGHYILHATIFNLKGKTMKIKKLVMITRQR